MLAELTHIPNRRCFDRELDNEWRRFCRDGTPRSVLMIDIDFFKVYNHHYGRSVGDRFTLSIGFVTERCSEHLSANESMAGKEICAPAHIPFPHY